MTDLTAETSNIGCVVSTNMLQVITTFVRLSNAWQSSKLASKASRGGSSPSVLSQVRTLAVRQSPVCHASAVLVLLSVSMLHWLHA